MKVSAFVVGHLQQHHQHPASSTASWAVSRWICKRPGPHPHPPRPPSPSLCLGLAHVTLIWRMSRRKQRSFRCRGWRSWRVEDSAAYRAATARQTSSVRRRRRRQPRASARRIYLSTQTSLSREFKYSQTYSSSTDYITTMMTMTTTTMMNEWMNQWTHMIIATLSQRTVRYTGHCTKKMSHDVSQCTEQRHCGACRRKWRLTDTDLCPCGETQTMSHIVESCPLTKLNGGLSRLHSADEDAVSWLTNYG